MVDQNFEQIFSHAYLKTVRAFVLKLLSVIYSPLKVELLNCLRIRVTLLVLSLIKEPGVEFTLQM